MPNIIFNSNCNRRCVYCFAQQKNEGDKREISLDHLTTACDFLERSRIKSVNVLGGEPTLHSRFLLLFRYLVSRGFGITLFSNGMIAKPVLTGILEIIDEWGLTSHHLKIVVNVNEDKYRSPTERRLQKRTFEALHEHIGLSFNIFEKSCDMNFLVDLIDSHRLLPRIRLGLAAPIAGRKNRFLPMEDYGIIARKVVTLSDRCQAHGIDFGFDCGFPMCMFSDEDIGRLFKNMARLQFVCDPVLDIDPDLNVIYCYPLSGYHSLKLRDFNNVKEIYDEFASLMGRDDRQRGIYAECAECPYLKSKRCAGGCKGFYLRTPGDTPTVAENRTITTS